MKLRINGLKKLLLSLTLATSILLALPAAAEGPKCKRGKCSPEERVSRMQSKLNLSDDQATQVKAIFESHQSEFDRIKSEMKNTLTDEQRQALKEGRKDRKSRRANKGERPSREERAQKRAQRFAEIGISEGQQAQLKSLKQQMRQERQLIKEELRAVLTPEQQATFDEKKKRRNKGRGSRA